MEFPRHMLKLFKDIVVFLKTFSSMSDLLKDIVAFLRKKFCTISSLLQLYFFINYKDSYLWLLVEVNP